MPTTNTKDLGKKGYRWSRSGKEVKEIKRWKSKPQSNGNRRIQAKQPKKKGLSKLDLNIIIDTQNRTRTSSNDDANNYQSLRNLPPLQSSFYSIASSSAASSVSSLLSLSTSLSTKMMIEDSAYAYKSAHTDPTDPTDPTNASSSFPSLLDSSKSNNSNAILFDLKEDVDHDNVFAMSPSMSSFASNLPPFRLLTTPTPTPTPTPIPMRPRSREVLVASRKKQIQEDKVQSMLNKLSNMSVTDDSLSTIDDNSNIDQYKQQQKKQLKQQQRPMSEPIEILNEKIAKKDRLIKAQTQLIHNLLHRVDSLSNSQSGTEVIPIPIAETENKSRHENNSKGKVKISSRNNRFKSKYSHDVELDLDAADILDEILGVNVGGNRKDPLIDPDNEFYLLFEPFFDRSDQISPMSQDF